MKTQDLLLIAGVAVAGFAAYKYFSTPTPPPQAGSGATFIPPNQTVGGYMNTTGAPVWVTATGVIMNGLGQILSSIPWNSFNSGGSSSSGSGSTSADFLDSLSY